MRKKQWLSIVMAIILIVPFAFPNFHVKAESEWQKIDRQLQEIQKEKADAAKKSKDVENKLKDVKQEQTNINDELTHLNTKIDDNEQKLFDLEKNISDITEQAKAAADELDKAEKRVEDRDELLKTRVKLMYRRGNVSYLEVLLGANSFSDFIQRFSAIEKIIKSDREILQDNINDKNTVAEKKQEIDNSLAKLETLYTESENIRADLLAQQKDRQVQIASLQEKEQELNDIKDDEEKFLEELATKQGELIKKRYDLKYNGGIFAWPVPSSKRITSGYGFRIDPINGKRSGHTGIDIGHAPDKTTLFGADIVAAADGVVIVATYVNGYGNTIIIDHGGNIWTLYGHIRNGGIKVKLGQKVKKGQKIAEVGSTGRSTGPHLHFEVRKNKVPVNPWDYLKDK